MKIERISPRVGLLGLLLVANMLLAGCTSFVDDAEDEAKDKPDELKEDSTIISRSLGSPELIGFENCGDLGLSIKDTIAQEYEAQLLQAVEEVYNYWGGGFVDDMVMEGDGAESATADGGSSNQQSQGSSPPARKEGEDYSGTNNQEEGVDEADFVKTDGYHIYYLNSKTLHILNTSIIGNVTLDSEMLIEGTPQAMMLDGNRLVVISSVSSWNLESNHPMRNALGWGGEWSEWRTSTLTKFTVIDISNHSDPTESRELYIEGYYNTAREVNGTVRTVTYAWLNIPGLKSWLELPNGYYQLEYDDPLRKELRQTAANTAMQENRDILDAMNDSDILPRIYERAGDVITTHGLDEDECGDFVAPIGSSNRGFISIFTLDLDSEELAFEADHILGNHPLVYSSADTMIITENSWDWWWFWGNSNNDEATNIHSFDIAQEGDTTYRGSGRVEGTILNQFSISEFEGKVRVATTTGQWGQWWLGDEVDPMESHVVVLEAQEGPMGKQALNEVGRVDGIAEGERIWSCRFDGEMAYVVTFRNMDPLWTIDLSDPTTPAILGELEVPGVSTYIHPLSKDTLLTIGLGPADEATGEGLDWSKIQISLFDVSDPTAPTRSAVLNASPLLDPNSQGWSWSWSEATYEHKAFQYWNGQLAIPLSTYRYNSGQGYWNYEYVSKLVIIDVGENSLTINGTIDHSDFYNRGDGHYYWGEYNVRRSIFMGDYIYAISAGGVTATNLTTMEQSSAVELTPEHYYNYYYAYEEDGSDKEGTVTTDSDDEDSEQSGSSGSSGSNDSTNPPADD
jgi:uncharacterized secreted protein with C-terminal beta-propeller domain